MDIEVSTSYLQGRLALPSSKSELHRALIVALLSRSVTTIPAHGISADVFVTIGCLQALGALVVVDEDDETITVDSTGEFAAEATLTCGESGTTLRFFVPLVAALGIKAQLIMEPGLAKRPHQVLLDQLNAHGCRAMQEGEVIKVEGQLEPGTYQLPANISSQYISGLLLALPLLEGTSVIELDGALQSAGYVTMTLDIMERADVYVDDDETSFEIKGGQTYRAPSELSVGGDWSAAAFWLVADALGANVHLPNLDEASYQPDAGIRYMFEHFGTRVVEQEDDTYALSEPLDEAILDMAQTPDLAPALAVLASAARGQTSFANAARLRLKESDRIASTCAMLSAVGIHATELEEGFAVYGPSRPQGGVVDSAGDHRIAMAAAILGSISEAPVTIKGAECVSKSYPAFWDDFKAMGGNYRVTVER